MESINPLILTLRLDEVSQQFFDERRALYFPAARNFLKAHLTLFHKLPDSSQTIDLLRSLSVPGFTLQVTGLINLGAGVAYQLESNKLKSIHQTLRTQLTTLLSPQDKQGFRPHITIQNKTTPAAAKALLEELTSNFKPFAIHAVGLDLWEYLGGPWAHRMYFPFLDANGGT
jgi:2'-5' RNA ligase